MNEVAKIQPAATLPPAANPSVTRAIDVALSGAVTQDGQTVLLPGKEIDPAARRLAEGRLSILSRCLDARSHAELTTIIGRMLAGFPSIRQSGDDARTLLLAYISMVDEFPPWAVSEACRRWAQNATQEKYSSLAFPPSAAQLREACEGVVYRYRAERAKLTQALAAKTQPVGSDEKGRVSAGFDKYRAELRSTLGSRKREQTPEEARAAFKQRCAELGIDPASVKDQPSTFRKLSLKDLTSPPAS